MDLAQRGITNVWIVGIIGASLLRLSQHFNAEILDLETVWCVNISLIRPQGKLLKLQVSGNVIIAC